MYNTPMISKYKFIILLLSIVAVISLMTSVVSASETTPIMVSLGDSYSSGEGIPPFYGQDADAASKVTDQDWLAHRSSSSWASMLELPSVGKMGDHRDTNWFFVACSGAVTSNLKASQKKEYDYKGLEGTEYIDAQLDVFNNFEYDSVDYVTLTLGGNDVGFSDIITEAAMGSSYLSPNHLSSKLNATWSEFYKDNGIRDNIRNAYHDISDAAGPNAKIIVAGYPKLLEQNGKGALFSKAESQLINESVTAFNKELNLLISSCKAEGIKICFVPVEDEFDGHEAYSDTPYINKVMIGARSEDLVQSLFSASAYSIHPNDAGAKAYARCVQAKIDELEKDGGESEWPARITSTERDIVLVLDVSGSMSGEPMESTKEAAKNFVDTVLKEEASIGIVTYDSESYMVSDFSKDKYYLNNIIDMIYSGGDTNTEAGLTTADDMFENSNAKKKAIVLMSDGCPTTGKDGDELIEVSNSIKKDDITIYTLGFFDSLSGYEKESAQSLMEHIASDGCHYEVTNADDLLFFFGDVADQLNGQKYMYIRIACPVDVEVSNNGETLCSEEDDLCTRTQFGTLSFEENTEESEEENDSGNDTRIKILRLKEGANYNVYITGNGRGKMNYTIGFMDDDGKYSDLRKFKNIKIKPDTEINTIASNTSTTILKVDEDGDGEYDYIYKAGINGRGKIVNDTYMLYIAFGIVAAFAILITIIKLYKEFTYRIRVILKKIVN